LGLGSLNIKELVSLIGGTRKLGRGVAADNKRGVESARGQRFVSIRAG
jgi:hypothetical protein